MAGMTHLDKKLAEVLGFSCLPRPLRYAPPGDPSG